MERLFIEGDTQLPRIILDKEQNKFEIFGQSIPEDVISFYTPIIRWLDDYILQPNENTELSIKMIYYNTASSKMIYEIIKRIDFLHQKEFNAKVLWHFANDDEDMEDAGVKYAEMFSVPFEFISYEPE